MVTEIIVANLPWVIPTVSAAIGGVVINRQYQSARKREYDTTRARLSADLIRMDEEISFAEAQGDPNRERDIHQARLALNAAFDAQSRHFGTDNHKGIAIKQASFEVDQHLSNSRMFLAGPRMGSNQDLIDAAKAVGRQALQLAKIGTTRFLNQSSQELTRLNTQYQDQRPR